MTSHDDLDDALDDSAPVILEGGPGPVERELLAALDGDDADLRATAALRLGAARLTEDREEGLRLLDLARGGPDPIAAQALVVLARDTAHTGDDARALQHLHLAQELAWRGGDTRTMIAVAEVYASLHQRERAIAVLEHVVNRAEGRTTTLTERRTLAAAALRVGRLLAGVSATRARSALRRAVDFADGDSSLIAAVELAAALRAEMRRAVDEGDGRGLADVRAAQLEELLRAAATSPDPGVGGQAQLLLGDVLFENGQEVAARDQWEAVAGDAFAGAAAQEARSRLTAGLPAEPVVLPEIGHREGLVEGLLRRPSHTPAASPSRAAGRGALKAYYRARGAEAPRRLLLVGAGSGARYLLPELRRDPGRFFIEGFVDDRPDSAYAGAAILGPVDRLADIARKVRPDEILLTAATASGQLRLAVLKAAWDTGVAARQLPPMFEIRRDRPLLPQIRPIRVEETYGQRPWLVDRSVHGELRGRTVLITGAGGTLGAELARQIARAQPERLVLVDRAEAALKRIHEELSEERSYAYAFPVLADCADAAEMDAVFSQHKPSIVFHCAALNHANMGELSGSHPARVNLLGPLTVTEAAAKAGAHDIICLSTDHAASLRTEHDAARALAEAAVLRAAVGGLRAAVLRVGSIWRSPGGVLDRFERQLNTGGPLMLTHPCATRRFSHAWEVGQAALRLLQIAQPGQMYAMNGGAEVVIDELARRMIALRGLRLGDDIAIEFATEIRRPSAVAPFGALEQPVPHPDASDIVEIQQDDSLQELLDDAVRAAVPQLRALGQHGGDADGVRAILSALVLQHTEVAAIAG